MRRYWTVGRVAGWTFLVLAVLTLLGVRPWSVSLALAITCVTLGVTLVLVGKPPSASLDEEDY